MQASERDGSLLKKDRAFIEEGARSCRVETFCFGAKNCTLYASGAMRKVPGRNGMVRALGG